VHFKFWRILFTEQKQSIQESNYEIVIFQCLHNVTYKFLWTIRYRAILHMRFSWHILSSFVITVLYDMDPKFGSAAAINWNERQLFRNSTTPNRTTTFWAVADVPFTFENGQTLASQLPTLGADIDFFIRLGDLKNGKTPCNQEALDYVDSIMKLSPVPVLMIIGDNEFNDCNIDLKVALDMWQTTFVDYETKYREPQFCVHYMQGRPEGFYFY
jgi:hypothetical protein